MKTLEQVRRQLMEGEFDFSHHAFRRAVERDISEREIREAGAGAVIVEEVSGGQVRTDLANIDSLVKTRFEEVPAL